MMLLIKIILAIFIPPLAAFLQVGLGFHFWINLLLSLCFVVPGQIHAIWLIATNKRLRMNYPTK